jgi:hypothetical protein
VPKLVWLRHWLLELGKRRMIEPRQLCIAQDKPTKVKPKQIILENILPMVLDKKIKIKMMKHGVAMDEQLHP